MSGPRPFGKRDSSNETLSARDAISWFVESPSPATDALLALFAELLVDDDDLRETCRGALAARRDQLPQPIADIGLTVIHRAVRMTHVVGNDEGLYLGVRLPDGQELTCAIHVDHLDLIGIVDAYFTTKPIADVLVGVRADNADPDVRIVDIDPSEAKEVLVDAFDAPLANLILTPSDTWPGCRALLQWVCRLLPDSGTTASARRRRRAERLQEILDAFFASAAGEGFDDEDACQLSQILDGTSDPLRWNTYRVRRVLGSPGGGNTHSLLSAYLCMAPLLRAYIPYAHAQIGIRQELTDEALSEIDQLRIEHEAALRDYARRDHLDHEDDWEADVG